jgi:hypothetical protein
VLHLKDRYQDGLAQTPARHAKGMPHATKGYEENLWDIVHQAVFTVKWVNKPSLSFAELMVIPTPRRIAHASP